MLLSFFVLGMAYNNPYHNDDVNLVEINFVSKIYKKNKLIILINLLLFFNTTLPDF